MLRVLSVVFCILVLCLSLCACGAKEEVEELATEAMSEVADTENGTVSDGDGYIGNESNGDYAQDATSDSVGQQNGNNSNNERMYGSDGNTGLQNDTDIFM